MKEESTMKQLIRAMHRKGASEDLIVAILEVLETEENFLKMLEEVSRLKNPSETALLGKAMLIAEP